MKIRPRIPGFGCGYRRVAGLVPHGAGARLQQANLIDLLTYSHARA
jgi:hypothetical protein